MNKKLIAEFIGTFVLSFVVLLSAVNPLPIPTPVLAGLVLGLFVFSIGAISGCHINPAVTIGLWSIKKIETREAIKYIAAQLLAGIVAFLLVRYMGFASLGITSPIQVLFFELLGMFVFTFGIASVVHQIAPSAMSGFVVGGSLLLGITISALGGAAGVLNPAVGIALGITNIGYYLVQIVGSILGFQLFSYVAGKGKSAINTYALAAAILIVCVIGFVALSGKIKPREIPVDTTSTSNPTADASLNVGTFRGTLPCADCSGLEMELTLTREQPYGGDGTYVLKQTYLGKNMAPLVTNGDWGTLRGNAKDPNATIYELDPDDPTQATYFLKVGDTQLKMLDSEQNEIDSPFNETLTLVK